MPTPAADHARGPLSCLAHTGGPTTCSPHKRGPLPVAHARDALLTTAPSSKSQCTHRERYCYGSLLLLILPFPTIATCFSCGSRPPPRFPWLWHSAPQPLVHYSLAPQLVTTQPTPVTSEVSAEKGTETEHHLLVLSLPWDCTSSTTATAKHSGCCLYLPEGHCYFPGPCN